MKSKKTKTIKRISLLVALAALVCMSLAMSVFANTTEPTGIKGDTCTVIGDVNGDGELTRADAVYLLYHSLFGDDYKLKQDGNFYGEDTVITGKDALTLLFNIDNAEFIKEVHAYDEPIWTWEETDMGMQVTAAYKCACGHSEYVATAMVTPNTTPATCTTSGSTTYTAKAIYDGVEFEATKTVAVPATGHVFEDDVKACEDKHCQNCDYTEEGDAHTIDLSAPIKKDVAVEGKECTFVNQYECTVCKATVDGPEYTKHAYEGTISKEATCKAAGEMLYTCKTCGAKETEEIAINPDAHTWNEGVTENGVTTYSCTTDGCDATRKTIVAVEGQAASATVDALKEVDEVEVNGAAVKLDDATLGQLTGTVTIDAQKTEVSELPSELTGKIDQVYDFSMTSNDKPVSNFEGKVTVTIPYKLGENEDPDCVNIAFINDETDKVEYIQGKYSNGCVTFETDHFSYYTVVRLTPAERCAKFGHSEKEIILAPNCTQAGYTRVVCLRCAQVIKEENKAALGHKHEVIDEKAATCTVDGYKHTKCANVGCKDEREVVFAAKGHAYTDTKVDATCSAKGYVHHVCDTCKHEEIEYDSTPIGHDCEETWTWSDDVDNFTASVKLACKRENCTYKAESDAVISVTKQIAASCAAEGETVYIAKVLIGNSVYDDAYTVVEEKLPHKLGNEVKFNSFYHYKECSVCGSRVNETEHTLDDGEVTVAATCGAAGVKVYSCKCGYVVEEEIPALEHEIVNGTCTNCGFKTSSCDHDDVSFVEFELSPEDGYCGLWVAYDTCECGDKVYINGIYHDCPMEVDTVYTKDENGYVKQQTVYTCKECGIKAVEDFWYEVAKDKCEATAYTSYKITDKNGKVLFDKTGIYYEEVEHATVVYVSQENLSKYGICDGTVVNTKCACGTNTGVSLRLNCDYTYNEATGTYACKDCGTYRDYNWKQEETGKKCEYKFEQTYTFYKGETEVASFSYSGIHKNHEDIETTYELHGTVCSDGYTVNRTCNACGETLKPYEANPGEGIHPTIYKEVDLSKYDLCNETAEVRTCPCGEENAVSYIGEHNWVWSEGEYEESEDGYSYTDKQSAKCADCGLEQKRNTSRTADDDSCDVIYVNDIVYSKGGTEILVSHDESTWQDHDEKVIAYKFRGEEESCEGGVEVTYECTKCNTVTTEYYGGHRTFTTAVYDAKDYGMCEGEIVLYSCVCGEEQGINWNTACEWMYDGYDPATGIESFKCDKCGIVRQQITKAEVIEGCYVKYTTQYDFVKGYDVVLSAKNYWYGYEHDLETTFKLKVEGGTCSDGYTVTKTCKNCDYVYSYEGQAAEGSHNTIYFDSYSMEDYGLCYGELNHYVCPCGAISEYYEYQGCDWEHKSYDEKTKTDTYKCRECGAVRTFTYTEGAQVGCQYPVYRDYKYYTASGKKVLEYTEQYISERHDYKTTVTLNEGSVTCEDGVTVSNTCRDCGYSHTYNSTGHSTGVVNEYDLSQYGSNCGGYLEERACACGAYKDVELRGECDYSWNEFSAWLGETYYSQETTSGYRDAYHRAYDITCAVTDPACDLSLRMCRYYVWDKTNCSMQEIEVWQLGYDKETGKYQKELTFNLDKFAYHDYESDYTTEGNTYVYTDTCKTCASSYVRTHVNDDNGNNIRSEYNFVNTLNNGEPKERTYYWVYDIYNYEVDGQEYETSYTLEHYNQHTAADGSISWYRETYAYDIENCTRIATYTSSNGEPYTYEQEYHIGNSDYVQLTYPSCTQQDRWTHGIDCPSCGQSVNNEIYSSEPWGHSYYYDEAKQVWVCHYCGLESASGSNGSVVLEDMTDEFGKDTNYVIGYWDRTNFGFTYYVSIVNGEDETILGDVAIDVLTYDEDGICALSINKAEVAAAAKTAGVSGDVRITFVPTGDAGTLDYAITLTE